MRGRLKILRETALETPIPAIRHIRAAGLSVAERTRYSSRGRPLAKWRPYLMNKSFSREISSLDGIFEFVAEFFAKSEIDASKSLDVELIIEELFTNMVKYRPEGRQPVSVQLERNGRDLVIRLTDFGVEPFDITQLPEVDTTLPIRQRKAGGLGMHFVRKMADSLAYEHADGNSRITVVKKLEV